MTSMIRRKHIRTQFIFILVFALLVLSVNSFADVSTEDVNQDVVTDGSQSCATWFSVFDNLLNNKETNGLKFFLILNSLRQKKLETQIIDVLSTDASRMSLLERYGLTSDSIYVFMNYFFATFPDNMDEVILYSDEYDANIYVDLYRDDDFDYSKYMVRFHEYLNQLFRQQPTKMQDIISKYDRLGAGEIVVMQGLLNIIIRDYIAFEIYHSISGRTMSQEFKLRNGLKQPLVDELVRVASTYTSDYVGDTSIDMEEIEEYVDVLLAWGNVMLESSESNLRESNMLDYAVELSKDTNLLSRTSYEPSVPTITVTLRMNTQFIELDSSEPLTNGSINEFQLSGEVEGVNEKIIYTIDKTEVANVSSSGLVTLSTNKQGTAVITATVEGYDVYKEITVNVTGTAPLGSIEFFGPYISGYTDHTFRTKNNVTRAEIATMMIRVLQLDLDDENTPLIDIEQQSYKDVNTNHWAHKYIELAANYKLLNGYDDGTFRPDEFITRAELAVIISNAWEELGIEQSELANHFIKDVDVDYWAYTAINRVYNANIVNGYRDGTYRPDNQITRGETVVMINGILDRVPEDSDKPTFIDVTHEHWAYGHIEAATKLQIMQNEISQ